MEIQPTSDSDVLEDDSNEFHDAAGFGDDEMTNAERRKLRIAEFEAMSLDRVDAYAAMIGASNAEFQQITDKLSAALLQVLEEQPTSIELVRELAPELRLLLKYRKAVEFDRQVHDPALEAGSVAHSPSVHSQPHLAHGARRRPAGLISKKWPSTH